LRKTSFPAIVSTAILCYVFWILVTGQLASIIKGEPSIEVLIAGAVVSIGVGIFAGRFLIHKKAFYLLNPKRWICLIIYAFVFLWELIKANCSMAVRALGRKPEHSGIVKVPVSLTSDYAQSMLANSITLTPGTITMDITEEGGQTYYYVHWISVSDEDGQKAGDAIKGTMEKWIRRIWE